MFNFNHVPPEQALPIFALLFAGITLYAVVGRWLAPKPLIVAPRITDRPPPPKNGREEWRLGGYIKTSICPDCGGEDFYEGPRGGMNVNLFCSNSKCRHGFNVANFGDDGVWAERIHDGPDRLYH
jgi:hypothetical protein